MRLIDIARRVDALFDVARYVEPTGWDFALTTDERAALLRHASPAFADTFNGLLCAGERIDDPVLRVYLLVFPERSLLNGVIAQEQTRGSPGALVLTHHPVDMETNGRGFLAIPPEQLAALKACRTALYVLHAPLDCNLEVSTSGAVVEGLGLRRVGTFAPYVGGQCGVLGEQAPEPFAVFAERVRRLCELPSFRADAVRFAGRDVRRVAVVAGGGDDVEYLREAEGLGADTYVAGHWWTPHPGAWCDQNRDAIRRALPERGMNLLSASHDGSELVVFRDRLLPLVSSWGVEAVLLRQADHWR